MADGPQRHRDANNYRARRRQIYDEVSRRILAEFQPRSRWHRLQLELAIRREVAARLKKEFPPAALHFNRISL